MPRHLQLFLVMSYSNSVLRCSKTLVGSLCTTFQQLKSPCSIRTKNILHSQQAGSGSAVRLPPNLLRMPSHKSNRFVLQTFIFKLYAFYVSKIRILLSCTECTICSLVQTKQMARKICGKQFLVTLPKRKSVGNFGSRYISEHTTVAR